MTRIEDLCHTRVSHKWRNLQSRRSHPGTLRMRSRRLWWTFGIKVSSTARSSGQQMVDHTPAVTRTMQCAADIACCRNGQLTSAKSLQRRWKLEIQMSLLQRLAAMTRAVLPNPSARAKGLRAGVIDRDLSTGLRLRHLTEAMTKTETQEQTPPYKTTMTPLLSPVINPHHCTHHISDRAQGDLELETVFEDHGVCSALQRVIHARCALRQPPPSALQLAIRRKSVRLLTDLAAVFALPASYQRVCLSSLGPGSHLV